MYKFLALAIASTFLLAYTNCGEFNIYVPDEIEQSSTALSQLQPVLAVRSPGCIMCHAKINGNMYTDFGYNSPYFFAQDDPENHEGTKDYSPLKSKHTFWGRSWKDASIMGNLHIPKANLYDSRVLSAYTSVTENPMVNEVSLRDLFMNNLNWPNDAVAPIIPFSNDPDINTPGLRGDVIEQDRIYIGAPSENEIRTLEFFPGVVRNIAIDLGVRIHKGGKHHTVRNIVIKENANRLRYVGNDGVLTCIGDLIIDGGAVVFKNLKLKTNEKGCRIYATNTVFIQGPIEYVDSGPTPSLQITSARAILMGMKHGKVRLSYDGPHHTMQGLREAPTEAAELIFNAAINYDIEIVQEDIEEDAGPYRRIRLKDPVTGNVTNQVIAYITNVDNLAVETVEGRSLDECGPVRNNWKKGTFQQNYQNCENDWANAFMRKTVNYEHLLLNAPKVYSRYHGKMKGVVIAEDALFAVGAFEFERDPVMDQVNLLPLVRDRVFSVD